MEEMLALPEYLLCVRQRLNLVQHDLYHVTLLAAVAS